MTGIARPTLAAVILAAGASTRMGTPKALASWRGKTLLEHTIALAHVGACTPIVVVRGAHALDVVAADVEFVTNEAWSDGPLSSLQTGLRTLVDGSRDSRPLSGVAVLSIDRPHVRSTTIVTLISMHANSPRSIWQPRHAGQHGHPMIWPWDCVAELLALERSQTARTLLSRPEIAARRRFADVDDDAVLDNIDEPADLERLRRS